MNRILEIAYKIFTNLNIGEVELTFDNLIESQFYCTLFEIMFPDIIE